MRFRARPDTVHETIVVVQPDPAGHRFEHVRHVAEVAGPIVLATSRGAAQTAEYCEHLGVHDVDVREIFSAAEPSTSELAAVLASLGGSLRRAKFVVLDADKYLPQWWLRAPRSLRRPGTVTFFLMRYPTRLDTADWRDWAYRASKAGLVLLARLTGALHDAVALTGRADDSPGRVVRRVQDPAACSASSADRAELRRELGLPSDRSLVGIFGLLDERKEAPLVLDAVERVGPDVDLLLGGRLAGAVAAWLESLPPERRARVRLRSGFLTTAELDRLVAAADVVAVVQRKNAPSGIMGKALAAGVPVLSAGSVLRAEELSCTGAGIATDVDVDAIAAGLRSLFDTRWAVDQAAAARASGAAYGRTLLNQAGRPA